MADIRRDPEKKDTEDQGGQVSEVAAMPRDEGEEVVSPGDAIAGHPQDQDVQEGVADPAGPPPENVRANEQARDGRK